MWLSPLFPRHLLCPARAALNGAVETIATAVEPRSIRPAPRPVSLGLAGPTREASHRRAQLALEIRGLAGVSAEVEAVPAAVRVEPGELAGAVEDTTQPYHLVLDERARRPPGPTRLHERGQACCHFPTSPPGERRPRSTPATRGR